MPSRDKLIKNGIKYTDALFDEIIHRLEQGVLTSDTLEAFLEQTKDYTTSNPLVTSGYDKTLLSLILAETNNHKFSRPAQKELVRVTIENKVGDLIRNVGDDIVTNVRDIVKYGYNNNLSQDEIAKEISDKVTGIKNKRARAIARTEIARTATISDYVISAERGATHFYVECRNTACPICKEAWHKGWTIENDDTYTPSDTSAGGKGWIGNKTYKMSQTDKLPPIHPNCRCVPYFYKDTKEEPVETKTTEPVTETVETKTEPVKKTASVPTEYGGKTLSASELKEKLGERKYEMFQKSSADIIKWSKQMEKLKPDDPRRMMFDGRIYGAMNSLDRLEKEALSSKPKKPQYPIEVETIDRAKEVKDEVKAISVRSEIASNKKTYDVYEFDGYSIAMDRELINSKNVATVQEVKDHLNSLPLELRTTGVRINIHNIMDLEKAGEYDHTTHEINIFNNGNRVTEGGLHGLGQHGMERETILDTVTHELAHAYDLKNYNIGPYTGNIASKEVWGAIVKEDNKLYKYRDERTGRMRTPKEFPTGYASESWYKASRSSNYDSKARQYCEDFAESTKLYLNPITHDKFVKDFPNRAKFLKEHYGVPNFKNYIVHKIGETA